MYRLNNPHIGEKLDYSKCTVGQYAGCKCGTCDVCTIVNMKLTSTAVELLLPRKNTLPSSIFRGKREVYVANVNSPSR